MKYNFHSASLGSVVDFIIDHRGLTPKKLGGDWKETGFRAISAKNIKNGSLVSLDTIRFVDVDIYKKWMPIEVKRNDIFITSEAPFGETILWKSDEKVALSQRIFGLRIKKIVILHSFITICRQMNLKGTGCEGNWYNRNWSKTTRIAKVRNQISRF